MGPRWRGRGGLRVWRQPGGAGHLGQGPERAEALGCVSMGRARGLAVVSRRSLKASSRPRPSVDFLSGNGKVVECIGSYSRFDFFP